MIARIGVWAAILACGLLMTGSLTWADEASPAKPADKKSRTLGLVLYPRFELLDAYGPAEIFGNLPGRVKLITVAQQAGPVKSAQGIEGDADYSFDDCPQLDLILVPGGFGSLSEIKNPAMLDFLKKQAENAEIVMSVCTGSQILAHAGLLDGRKATSNKQYFTLATSGTPKVNWIKQARWVDDGNRVTSSGVSAGIDMSLHVVEQLFGTEVAEQVANGTEYQWHRDADNDPFVKFVK
jgi:transcriptional regulator GlxA family with amidase domain